MMARDPDGRPVTVHGQADNPAAALANAVWGMREAVALSSTALKKAEGWRWRAARMRTVPMDTWPTFRRNNCARPAWNRKVHWNPKSRVSADRCNGPSGTTRKWRTCNGTPTSSMPTARPRASSA